MEPTQKSNGALIGLVVIVIILIVGGVYIWISNRDSLKIQAPAQQEQKVTAQDSTSLDNLSNDLKGLDTSTGVDVNSIN
jgi:uncharacterized protein (UPF0333 family)